MDLFQTGEREKTILSKTALKKSGVQNVWTTQDSIDGFPGHKTDEWGKESGEVVENKYGDWVHVGDEGRTSAGTLVMCELTDGQKQEFWDRQMWKQNGYGGWDTELI